MQVDKLRAGWPPGTRRQGCTGPSGHLVQAKPRGQVAQADVRVGALPLTRRPEAPSGHAGRSPGRPGTTLPGPVHRAGVRRWGGWAGGLGPVQLVWLPRLTVCFKGRVYWAIAGKKDGVPGNRSEPAQRRVGRTGIHCLGVIVPVFLAVTRGGKVRGQSWGGPRAPGRGVCSQRGCGG